MISYSSKNSRLIFQVKFRLVLLDLRLMPIKNKYWWGKGYRGERRKKGREEGRKEGRKCQIRGTKWFLVERNFFNVENYLKQTEMKLTKRFNLGLKV